MARESVVLNMEFHPGPRKMGADWAEAGFVPADRFVGSFPAAALPGVAIVEGHCRLANGRVVVLRVQADNITEGEIIGADMHKAKAHGGGCVAVTREQANAAIEEWQGTFATAS